MIKEFDYESDMESFIDDVCIVIAGKRNKLLTNHERMVYLKSYARLEARGCNLIVARGAQMKLESMKNEIDCFKKVCAEDNIILKD